MGSIGADVPARVPISHPRVPAAQALRDANTREWGLGRWPKGLAAATSDSRASPVPVVRRGSRDPRSDRGRRWCFPRQVHLSLDLELLPAFWGPAEFHCHRGALDLIPLSSRAPEEGKAPGRRTGPWQEHRDASRDEGGAPRPCPYPHQRSVNARDRHRSSRWDRIRRFRLELLLGWRRFLSGMAPLPELRTGRLLLRDWLDEDLMQRSTSDDFDQGQPLRHSEIVVVSPGS